MWHFKLDLVSTDEKEITAEYDSLCFNQNNAIQILDPAFNHRLTTLSFNQ
jgi:hypothetical protein